MYTTVAAKERNTDDTDRTDDNGFFADCLPNKSPVLCKPSVFFLNKDFSYFIPKEVSSGFKGKMLVMYVHQPSLFVILTKGKTITGTINEFYIRLETFLNRKNFDQAFIEKEMEMIREGYIISKTNSKSMLGSMNAITENIEYRCSTYGGYDALDVDYIEDAFMDWLVYDKTRPYYLRRTSDYWREKGLIK